MSTDESLFAKYVKEYEKNPQKAEKIAQEIQQKQERAYNGASAEQIEAFRMRGESLRERQIADAEITKQSQENKP